MTGIGDPIPGASGPPPEEPRPLSDLGRHEPVHYTRGLWKNLRYDKLLYREFQLRVIF